MDDILCDLKVFFDIEDAEEELTSAQFFLTTSRLSAYRGALRQQIEIYVREHKDELEADSVVNASPISLSPAQLRDNPRLGAAPGAGQAAPLFDVQQVSS